VIKLSVQVSYKKQVTLGIIGVTILLLAIEVIANVWWITQIHCEFEQNEIFQNFDEVEKRQLCLDFYNLKISGDEIIPNQSTNSITINSLGFRGTEFSVIKPSDTYRIFMIGGSTMFGAGATSDETTIPGYLQHLLNEKDFGFDIAVINSGIQGADSNTELNLIEQKLIRFSPDLIIIYDGWNDLRANHTLMEVKENWETICEFGKKNDFDVIITLQPIAGFGNKILTKQELEYAQTGTDYNNSPLIESLSVYQDYAKKLSEIKTCTGTFDLRGVYDTEVGPIYWDEAHVSDIGNSIIAKSLNTTIFPIVSKNYELGTFENKKDAVKTSLLVYDNREIVVEVELLPSNEFENKKIQIITHDNTSNEVIQNVTYFLSVSKDNENLLGEYFFAEDGILIIDIQPNNDSIIKVIGEKQYDNNAYVMLGSKYSHGMSEENLTSVTPLQIIGPIFDTEGIYTFDIELRTIDSRDNWVFSLSGFHSQVTIGEDIILKDSIVKDQPSFQIEDLLRKIFSYYKTPILLNEIFKW
jgi:lysophospholipase L1-like esterase